MLKRNLSSPADSQPSTPKNTNAYLVRLQKMKAKNNKIMEQNNTQNRKRSTKSEMAQINNWIKQDTAQSDTQPTQQKITKSHLIKPNTKQGRSKQDKNYSCVLSKNKNQKQQLNYKSFDIQHSNFNHLDQFINFCLQKNQKKQKKPEQNYTIQMQNNPLSAYKQKLQQANRQLLSLKQKLQQKHEQQQKNEKQYQIQTIEADRQTAQTQIKILTLINNHTQYRSMIKKISRLQKEIHALQQQNQMQFQQCRSQITNSINQIKNSNNQLIQNTKIYEEQLRIIVNLRQKIKQLQQSIQIAKKVGSSYNKLNQQLIKQKSISNIKVQLQKNIKYFSNNAMQKSNKQIVDQFYQNLNKKINIIKNTFETQDQKHKFLAHLKLQQSQSKEKINLTIQSNQLNQEQLLIYKDYRYQYNVYNQYLKNDPEIVKLCGVMANIAKRHQTSLNKIKMEVQNVKKQVSNQTNLIKQLDSLQAIREAEIEQLQLILAQKKQLISSRVSLNSFEQDSFDIFRYNKGNSKKS